MAKATSVVDVILGEAVSGTREQRYEDMLGIASVIDNRSERGKVAPEQVISNTKEFNAYDKALPTGVENYRDLAEQAWAQVQTYGPVHNGMFYATDAAKGKLGIKGLEEVAKTTGHVYYDDPQNRSFAIQGGKSVTPAPERQALAEAYNPLVDAALPGLAVPDMPVSSYAPNITSPAQFAFSDIVAPTPVQTTSITPNAVPSPAPEVAAVPSAPSLGMAALAPNGLLGEADYGRVGYSHPGRGTWDANLTPEAVDSINMMANMNPEGVHINSGYRSPAVNANVSGAKASQHMLGNAYDMSLTGMTDAEKAKAVEQARMSGATRVGAYSKTPDIIHVDFAQGYAPKTDYAVDVHPMFNESYYNMSSAPGWFTQGLAQTTVPTPTDREQALADIALAQSNAPTVDMAAAAVPGLGDMVPSSTFTAPVGEVERSSLPDVPSVPESVVSDYASTLSVPGFDYSVAPSGTQVASLAPASVESVERSSLPDIAPAVPSTPSTQSLADAYGQLGASLSQAGVTGLAGNTVTPTTPSATFSSLPAELTAPANTFQTPTPSVPSMAPAVPSTPAVPTVTAAPAVTAPAQTTPAPAATTAAPSSKSGGTFGNLGSRLGGAAIGGALAGVPGAIVGGLLGPTISNVGKGLISGVAPDMNLGGLLSSPSMPESTFNVGTGLDAIDGIFSGSFGVGATAFSTGNPNVSFTDIGNGQVAKTNSELGTTSIVNASSFGWNGGSQKSSTPSTSQSNSWGLGDVFGGIGDAISDAFSGFGDWGGDTSSSANDHSYSE